MDLRPIVKRTLRIKGRCHNHTKAMDFSIYFYRTLQSDLLGVMLKDSGDVVLFTEFFRELIIALDDQIQTNFDKVHPPMLHSPPRPVDTVTMQMCKKTLCHLLERACKSEYINTQIETSEAITELCQEGLSFLFFQTLYIIILLLVLGYVQSLLCDSMVQASVVELIPILLNSQVSRMQYLGAKMVAQLFQAEPIAKERHPEFCQLLKPIMVLLLSLFVN